MTSQGIVQRQVFERPEVGCRPTGVELPLADDAVKRCVHPLRNHGEMQCEELHEDRGEQGEEYEHRARRAMNELFHVSRRIAACSPIGWANGPPEPRGDWELRDPKGKQVV